MKQESRLQIKKDIKEFIRCAIKDGATENGIDLMIDDIIKLNNQQWVEEIEKGTTIIMHDVIGGTYKKIMGKEIIDWQELKSKMGVIDGTRRLSLQ